MLIHTSFPQADQSLRFSEGLDPFYLCNTPYQLLYLIQSTARLTSWFHSVALVTGLNRVCEFTAVEPICCVVKGGARIRISEIHSQSQDTF